MSALVPPISMLTTFLKPHCSARNRAIKAPLATPEAMMFAGFSTASLAVVMSPMAVPNSSVPLKSVILQPLLQALHETGEPGLHVGGHGRGADPVVFDPAPQDARGDDHVGDSRP